MADFRREVPSAHGPNAENLLQPLVTCGICMELFVDPVEFLNCLHLACGACAVEWLGNSSTCPQCRENVHGTRDSHYATAVADVYQAIAPNSDLCRARTAEERRTLREKYRPGRGAVSRNQTRTTRDRSQPEPPRFDFGPDVPDLAQLSLEAAPLNPGQASYASVPTFFDHAAERSTVNLENLSSVHDTPDILSQPATRFVGYALDSYRGGKIETAQDAPYAHEQHVTRWDKRAETQLLSDSNYSLYKTITSTDEIASMVLHAEQLVGTKLTPAN
ncbi:hypothetical protein FRC07_005210 [Ceratobasidium sp. 392]|nr:hypothetical protein FRC07_005210 [Ceratobasidium sp. 392]